MLRCFGLFAVTVALNLTANVVTARAGLITSVTPHNSNSASGYVIHTGAMGDNASPAYDSTSALSWIADPGPNNGMGLLTGGDFVTTVDSDKANANLTIDLSLSAPADVYVWIDDRVLALGNAPDWMTAAGFSDTGLQILLGRSATGEPFMEGSNIFPFSIFHKSVTSGSVTLGGNVSGPPGTNSTAMYGFAAVESSAAVPEPASLVLFGFGSLGIAVVTRRRTKLTEL